MLPFRLAATLVTAASVGLCHGGGHPEVEITVDGDHRRIVANGLPDHSHGVFPNVGNPNRIQPQRYSFRVPLKPTAATHPVPARGILFGVALNGVVFDPGTAERWGSLHYDARGGIDLGLDANHAHVQPSGAYHYHGQPRGLVAALGGNETSMRLLGYAADGYPIYASRCPRDPADLSSPLIGMRSSYRLKPGQRSYGPSGRHDGTFVEDYEFVAGLGDLDACNGRTGKTPEYPQGTYYYVLTPSFPFVPRMFHGLPDLSFSKFAIGAPEPPSRLAQRGRRGGPRGRQQQGGPSPRGGQQGFGPPPPPPGGQQGPQGGQGFGPPPPPPGGQQGPQGGQGFPPPRGGQGGQGFPPPPPPPGGGQQGGPPPPREGRQGFPPGGGQQGGPPPPPRGQPGGARPPRGGQGGHGFPPPPPGEGPPPPPEGEQQGGPQGFPPPPPPPHDEPPAEGPSELPPGSRWFL